jgi:methylmalonyl-CoA mutase N-terminal domain/subunit
MTKTIEGIPKLLIEAAARKQTHIDSGQDIIVGVNEGTDSKRRSSNLTFSMWTTKWFANSIIRWCSVKPAGDTERDGV